MLGYKKRTIFNQSFSHHENRTCGEVVDKKQFDNTVSGENQNDDEEEKGYEDNEQVLKYGGYGTGSISDRVHVFNVLLHYYSIKRDVKEGIKVYEEMTKFYKVAPNSITLEHLMFLMINGSPRDDPKRYLDDVIYFYRLLTGYHLLDVTRPTKLIIRAYFDVVGAESLISNTILHDNILNHYHRRRKGQEVSMKSRGGSHDEERGEEVRMRRYTHLSDIKKEGRDISLIRQFIDIPKLKLREKALGLTKDKEGNDDVGHRYQKISEAFRKEYFSR